MIKVLVTGATGFAGGYLCEHLSREGKFDTTGIYSRKESLQKSPVKDKIKFVNINLGDFEPLFKLINEIKPDYIFHLAGSSAPRDSFSDPIGVMHNNYESQINLFEAVKKAELKSTRILITSSGDIYGKPDPGDLPINERTLLRPVSPYAVSKIAQDFSGFQYFYAYRMNIIIARPFNHIGPRQDSRFVISDFSKQIASIENGKIEPVMKVGDLTTKRDFTDVRDIVHAYLQLIEMGTPGEIYNIGSGRSRSIREMLDILLSFSTAKISLVDDKSKYRPGDIPEMRCDSTKIYKLTGWKPEIEIEKTLSDTLDYWRKIV